MKYAVISLNDNSWQFESDSEDEAFEAYSDLFVLGTPCVMVEVIRSTDGNDPPSWGSIGEPS